MNNNRVTCFRFHAGIDDKPGTIDGWLLADDTVKLQIRDGPALQAAASHATAQ